jgi:hypothetical protein
VGRDRHPAQRFHEALGVVVFVCAQRDPLGPAERIHKFCGGLPFGRACRLCHHGTYHQTVPVIHQDVSKVSQLRFRALALLEQIRIFVRL